MECKQLQPYQPGKRQSQPGGPTSKGPLRPAKNKSSNIKTYIYKAGMESAKFIAANVFLNTCSTVLSRGLSDERVQMIKSDLLVAPFLEELFFRVVLLKGLQGSQILYNNYRNRTLSNDEKQVQQATRVYATAIFFGLCHWSLGVSLPHKLLKTTIISLSGVSHGYLMENYGSLGVNVLAHGLHNMLGHSFINDTTQNLPLEFVDKVGRMVAQHGIIAVEYSVAKGEIKKHFHHPVAQKVLRVFMETMFVLMALSVLYEMKNQLSQNKNENLRAHIYSNVIIYPFVQTLANFMLIHIIQRMQPVYHKMRGQSQPKSEQKIHVLSPELQATALLNATTSLILSPPATPNRLIQFSVNYVSSLGTGYVMKRYNHIALPMLAQGVKNVLTAKFTGK